MGQPVADAAPLEPLLDIEEPEPFETVEAITHRPVLVGLGQCGQRGREQPLADGVLQLLETIEDLV
jgi:hypothetical protein